MIFLFSESVINKNIPILALIIATLSALYSFRNGNIAKKAMKIAEQGLVNKKSNFSLYLIDSFRVIINNNTIKKLLLFHLSINNKSENKNSFKIILEISFIRTNNSIVKITLNHTPQLKDFIPQKKLILFDEDIRVDEKGIQSKWLIFEQSTPDFEKYRIDKYTIKCIDVNGVEKDVEVVLLKDINYEIWEG